ncbi:MAG: invasion associated locus B family protein, partial [Alphaproteobacteria bacterium]|nr:invasion associated locus B family protein [Alphaproteobacteria bacterium]
MMIRAIMQRRSAVVFSVVAAIFVVALVVVFSVERSAAPEGGAEVAQIAPAAGGAPRIATEMEQVALPSWAVRCDDAPEGVASHCEVYHRLTHQETGRRIVEFAVSRPAQTGGAFPGVVILPLGILL